MKNVLSSMTAQAALLLVIGCFALAALLPGCSGNNPSGPSGSAAVTSTATPTAGVGGTTVLFGSILDLNTKLPINNIGAAITVNLYKDGVLVLSRAATNNNFFTFSDIAAGIFYLEAVDASGKYAKNYAIVQLAANTQVQQDVSMQPSAASGVASYNVIGKLVNAVDSSPIMLAKVSLGTGALTTNTLEDGSFILYGVSEGQYSVTFSKTGFEDLNLTLIASSTNVFNGNAAAIAGTVVDGAGATVNGRDIGLVKLGPSIKPTGAILARLRDPLTNIVVINTRVNLWYKPDRGSTTQPGVIHRPTTNDQGYLNPINLPSGFYAIASLDSTAVPVFDLGGALIGYNFTGTVYTGAYVEVVPPSTTTLPSD